MPHRVPGERGAHTSAAPSGLLLQDGRTPLHMAVQSGSLEVVRELLRGGAALDAVDEVRPAQDWWMVAGAIASNGSARHWRAQLDDMTTSR
jgi:hypothetical protein